MLNHICPACGTPYSTNKCKPFNLPDGRLGTTCWTRRSATERPENPDYYFVKPAKNGMGGVYYQRKKKGAAAADHNPFYKPAKPQNKDAFSDTELNREYRKLIAQLQLSPFHSNKFKKRGFDDRSFFINAGFRSFTPNKKVENVANIPGVQDGMLREHKGIFIPSYTPWGKIIGGQIAPDNKYLPKYKTIKDAHAKRQNGLILSFAYAFPSFATEKLLPSVTLSVSQRTDNTNTYATSCVTNEIGSVLEICRKKYETLPPDMALQQTLLMGLQSALKVGGKRLVIKGVSQTVKHQLAQTQLNQKVETIARLNRELLDKQADYLYSYDEVDFTVSDEDSALEAGAQYFDLKQVWFVDGTAKAWYTAYKHHVAVIGCPMANHASNIKDLAAYLTALNPETCIHAPDAGDMVNTNAVPRVNRKLHLALEQLGYNTKVAWWDQREKEPGNDIDDRESFEDLTFITPDEFMAMHPDKIRAAMDDNEYYRPGIYEVGMLAKAPRDIKYKPPMTFPEGHRIATLQTILDTAGVRIVHDKSFAGAGKSHDFNNLQPEDLGCYNIIWLCNDAVNLEYPGWVQYRGRDHGRKTRESDGRIVIASADDNPDNLTLRSNCSAADKASYLTSHNVTPDARLLCADCPTQTTCKSTEGFYLYDRDQALKARRVRMNPSGFDASFIRAMNGKKWKETEDKRPGTIVICDDISPWETSTTVTRTQINTFIGENEVYLSKLPKLRNALCILMSQTEKDDMTNEEIRSQLPDLSDLDEDVLLRLFVQAEEQVLAAFDEGQGETLCHWIEDLLNALKDGVLHTYKHQLVITQRNSRFINACNHEGVRVIWADATATNEHLKLWLKSGTDIPCIAQELPAKQATVIFKQIVGLGDIGYTRSTHINAKVKQLTQWYAKQHPNSAIIDVKKHTEDLVNALAWRSTSRGSNAARFKQSMLVIGTPRANIAALQAKYTLMTGLEPEKGSHLVAYPVKYSNREGDWVRVVKESTDTGFAEFCHLDTTAELTQGFNRLRQVRRPDETVTIYFASEYPLDFAVEAVTMKELIQDPTEARPQPCKGQIKLTESMIEDAGAALLETGSKITYAAIASYCNATFAQVRWFFNQPGRDWKRFKMAGTLTQPVLHDFVVEFLEKTEKNNIYNNINTARQNHVVPSQQGLQPLYPPFSPEESPADEEQPETVATERGASPDSVYYVYIPPEESSADEEQPETVTMGCDPSPDSVYYVYIPPE